MSVVISKVGKFGSTIWEHKKKTAFAGFLAYLGADWVIKWNLNKKIRHAYALEAVKYGKQTISAEARPRRICVLANVNANERHCYDDFVKNALPLFHLAGIQVDIIKSDSETQLESLAAALDTQEADAMYVVGGDGSIGRVVTGIMRNRDKAAIPVGIYPGGYDNLTLKRLVPNVYENDEDVRRSCESAMAVIEEQLKNIPTFQVTIDGSEAQPLYSIGDVGAGWFRHLEAKRRKMWYFGGLKRRWAHVWEMIKRSPVDIEGSVVYESSCTGCRTCRPPIPIEIPPWKWWHILTGPPRYKEPLVKPKDYSNIINENCGRLYQLDVKGSEVLIENEVEEDSSRLHLRVGGTDAGRFGVMREGWRRCSNNIVGRSTSDGYYTTDVLARAITFSFNYMPDFIRKIYVSSDAIELPEEGERVVRMSVSNKTLPVYLPSQYRIQTETL